VDFIFDKGIIGQREREVWAEARATLSPMLAQYAGDAPIERDDKCTLPIQAADMLGWLARRRYAEANEGNQYEWRWDPITVPLLQTAWRGTQLLVLKEQMLAIDKAAQAKKT
jgi:hypothetical protein